MFGPAKAVFAQFVKDSAACPAVPNRDPLLVIVVAFINALGKALFS
jgi:hypothetical protein